MAAKADLIFIGMLASALAFTYSGFAERPKAQSGAGKESPSQQLDQNAELGKGHLGPKDPATKAGGSEQEHRASQSGHGQNDPLSGKSGSGKRAGGSGKSAESDFGGQSASDQGK